MKNYRSVLFSIALIFSAQTSHAQGFVLGMLVGSSLSDDNYSSSNPSVLYEAPYASLRLKDPLEIKMQSSDWLCFSKSSSAGESHTGTGKTLKQIISLIDGGLLSGGIEILRISNVVSPSNTRCAYIWIQYTEKSNMLTMEELQKLKQEKKSPKKK